MPSNSTLVTFIQVIYEPLFGYAKPENLSIDNRYKWFQILWAFKETKEIYLDKTELLSSGNAQPI